MHQGDESACHGVIEGVARLAGDDVGLNGAADEGKIADEIEKFVAGQFIFEAKLVIDGRGGNIINDQEIARGEVGKHAADTEELCFAGETEGAGGGDIFGVASGGLIAAAFPVGILSDGEAAGAGDMKFVAIGGAGGGAGEDLDHAGGIAIIADDLPRCDDEGLDGSRGNFKDGKQGFDDGKGGAIEDRRGFAGECDEGGGDVEAGESGKDVLDGVDEDGLVVLGAEDEGGGANVVGLDQMIDVGGDGRKVGMIGAGKEDAAVCIGRDGEGDGRGREERGPRKRDGGTKRLERGGVWGGGWG